jgi:DNA mismatch repair protein MutS
MNFEIDQQSFDDLAIFSKPSSMFSIFEIYSRTRTAGGREKMAEMMRAPSNNINLLCERRDSIRFFIKSGLELKISFESLDLILHYLNHSGEVLRDNAIDSFISYIKSKITPNQTYYNIKVGLQRLLPMLSHGKLISENLINSNVEYLRQLGRTIATIIDKPDFKYAIDLSENKKLNFYQLAKTDSIIRKNYGRDLNKLLEVFYELDVFETLSRVSTKNNFCLPSYFEDDCIVKIEIDGLFHPAIINPVTTNVEIKEESNLMFLSGSNMSGKSSFLKSLGLAVYLSHLGFPVPSKKINTVVFNGLLTTINLPDSVQSGLSHYYSEVVRIKKIATLLKEKKKMFILLDELFKGTNSKDAFEASLLVLNGFAEIKSSIFVVSSHITELGPMLIQKNVRLKYLEHSIINNKPTFSYILKEGIAEEGIGMYFIENEKIKETLEQAKHLSY